MNQFDVKILIDLFTQSIDPGFDDIGLGIEMIVPHMLHDHGFGHHPAGIAHQVGQQGKSLAAADPEGGTCLLQAGWTKQE